MYRIEVATGEETVFRTVEELATGIRNGLITPRSRVYHAASQKWLPIEFHPHYKKALDLVTGGAPMIDTGLKPAPRRTPAPAPAPPPPPAPRVEAWRPARPPAPAPMPAPLPAAPAPEARRPAPAPTPEPRPAPSFSPGPSSAGSTAVTLAVEPRSYLPPEALAARGEVGFPFLAPAPTPIPAPALVPASPRTTLDIELPTITYPDVPHTAPTDAHPVARRRPAPRASLLFVGAVAATIAGGYLVRGSDASGSAPAAEQPATVPSAEPSAEDQQSEYGSEGAFPEEEPPPAPAPAARQPASKAAAAPAPTPTPAPLMPAAAAPRPTGPVSQAWSSSAGAIAPVTAPKPAAAAPSPPATDVPAIAPPPAALDLALPQLPSAETIGVAAEARRDSAAMKRILRAVSGKPATGKESR